MQQAPDHEVPTGPVPQARQEEDDQQVEVGACPAAPVAAQRYVQVVPEPGAEADVPTSPELAHRTGDVGPIEVLQEVEPEHASQADGHVAVAAEVKVDLQGVGHHAQPGHGRWCHVHGQGEDGIGDARHLVRDQHLLRQTDHETPDATGEQRYGHDTVRDLAGQIPVPYDRAGDQLGEQADVQGHRTRVPLGLRLAPVHVHHVADPLEDEEGDPDRQVHRFQGWQGHAQRGEHRTERISEEAGVLEPGQCPQVQHDGRHQRPPVSRPPGQRQPGQVVHQDGGEHEQEVHPLAPRIEQQAGDQQHRVPGPGAPRQQHGQQRQRQEQEQEDRGTEDHRRGRKRVASESRAVLLVPDRKSYVNSM